MGLYLAILIKNLKNIKLPSKRFRSSNSIFENKQFWCKTRCVWKIAMSYKRQSLAVFTPLCKFYAFYRKKSCLFHILFAVFRFNNFVACFDDDIKGVIKHLNKYYSSWNHQDFLNFNWPQNTKRMNSAIAIGSSQSPLFSNVTRNVWQLIDLTGDATGYTYANAQSRIFIC